MLERKLQELIGEAQEVRKRNIENNSANFLTDRFYSLSNFIIKKLQNSLLKNKSAKIIANHFDEIFPYIVSSNTDILFLNINLLIEQPDFKKKFAEGLKKYPYKDQLDEIFYHIRINFDSLNEFTAFMDDEILKTLSTLNLRTKFYTDILNKIDEESQKKFLKLLIENKCNINYSIIEYKGNNKQIVYDNITMIIENTQNLYELMNFAKDNAAALSQVKNYIDNNEEKAMNSIFCETDYLGKMKDPTIKEIVKLMILDIMKNENVKFSDITYNAGGFSRIILIGDKVIKLGDRKTKSFPNNPYIIAPLLRKELKTDTESCFVEVTERVDTSVMPNKEELYQLFKNLHDLGLIWTDIKGINAGRLKRKNIIHWRENLEPTEEILGLDTKRGATTLEKGDLVVLDADFIYDENDPNINYTNSKVLYDEFEERYQNEKKKLKDKQTHLKSKTVVETDVSDYKMNEHSRMHR